MPQGSTDTGDGTPAYIWYAVCTALVLVAGWWFLRPEPQPREPFTLSLGGLTQGTNTLRRGTDYQTPSDREVTGLTESLLAAIPEFKTGFSALSLSLSAQSAIAAETVPRTITLSDTKDALTTTYTLSGLTVTSEYKVKKKEQNIHSLDNVEGNVKQTITLSNTTDESITTDVTVSHVLPTDTFRYDGKEYTATEEPQTFKAYEKTAPVPEFAKDIGYEHPEETEPWKNFEHTYTAGTRITWETSDDRTAFYDWGDAAHLPHTVTVQKQNGQTVLTFTTTGVFIPAHADTVIDPAYALSAANAYSARYDGSAAGDWLTYYGTLSIGDVNGDGKGDLILGASLASTNGSQSGSAYVLFSTLIDDIGTTTGNNRPLSTAANYNLRYDGAAASDQLTDGGTLTVGDVNGDGAGDLILGAPYYGATDTGSAYVLFSTLIDDIGTTTGNNRPLSTAANYNLRYDGAAASDYLTSGGALTVGDVNADGHNDLILGAYRADNNGSQSGSAYVLFSTLIDDIGTTTGNNRPLSTAANYNLRYDGAAASAFLTDGGALTVGDVNGDGAGDLILGANNASTNGSYSGSAYVLFSTLIDDIGTTTGNNRPLSTAANYNLRYDGAAASDYLTSGGALTVGDVNADGHNDLILGASSADNNGVSSGAAWVMFSTLIDDVGTTTGNTKPLSTATNYNLRYDGSAASDYLTSGGALTVGDVNADGHNDLILGAYGADYNGLTSGSAWVMFSTLIDDVGTTTGNNRPLSTATNYNLRYDGSAASDWLTSGGALTVGDVNGDGAGDFILGAPYASTNGSYSGSAYVIFSTLIDDIGTTTGNNRPLSTAANYNLRYDGSAADEQLMRYGAFAIGDVNGDGQGDLILDTPYASTNGSLSGSAWVITSTLIQRQAPQPKYTISGHVEMQGHVEFQ